LAEEKIPPIHIHCNVQAVYGDKCFDVSLVTRWTWQFKQEQVGEERLYDRPW